MLDLRQRKNLAQIIFFMTSNTVLVVEDEELLRSILRRLLEAEGYKVLTADSGERALEIFSAENVAVTLTDIRMNGAMDGLDLLDRLKSVDEEALVVVMTAFSSVDTAIAALRKGAYDYVTKPFVNEDLLQTVKNAIRQKQLFGENRALRRELDKKYSFSEIIGNSEALQSVFRLVEKVADTNTNVLIQGESGTGKELIARALHFHSSRSSKPFLAVNCGALPENLLESELFGHTKGAFTGASADKKGLFRSADGGTIFLDEIGEISSAMQVRLLRALQEHEVTPLGSSIPIKFNARIITATNRDLEKEIEKGAFREDLFYRLNVIEIFLPPLRARREDIPLLVKHFVKQFAVEQNVAEKEISAETINLLLNYSFPGNVRELQNAVERAFTLSGTTLEAENLPPRIRQNSSAILSVNGADKQFQPTLDEVEKRYIYDVMNAVNQDKAAAAQVLGIDLSTLYRKLKRYEE